MIRQPYKPSGLEVALITVAALGAAAVILIVALGSLAIALGY